MADLRQEEWTGELSKSVSESDHEASADELLKVLTTTLKRSTDDEDSATNPDADLSAITIGDVWSSLVRSLVQTLRVVTLTQKAD